STASPTRRSPSSTSPPGSRCATSWATTSGPPGTSRSASATSPTPRRSRRRPRRSPARPAAADAPPPTVRPSPPGSVRRGSRVSSTLAEQNGWRGQIDDRVAARAEVQPVLHLGPQAPVGGRGEVVRRGDDRGDLLHPHPLDGGGHGDGGEREAAVGAHLVDELTVQHL